MIEFLKGLFHRFLLWAYGEKRMDEIREEVKNQDSRIRERREARIQARVDARVSLGPKAQDFESWLGISGDSDTESVEGEDEQRT